MRDACWGDAMSHYGLARGLCGGVVFICKGCLLFFWLRGCLWPFPLSFMKNSFVFAGLFSVVAALHAAEPQKIKELQSKWDAWNTALAQPRWGGEQRNTEGVKPGARPGQRRKGNQ